MGRGGHAGMVSGSPAAGSSGNDALGRAEKDFRRVKSRRGRRRSQGGHFGHKISPRKAATTQILRCAQNDAGEGLSIWTDPSLHPEPPWTSTSKSSSPSTTTSPKP